MNSAQATTGILGEGVLSESSPAHEWERRIAEKSEELYRVKLTRRFFLVWNYPGNLLLILLAVLYFVVGDSASLWMKALAVLVLLGSIAASARLTYVQHFKVRAVQARLRELRRAYSEHLLEEFAAGDVFASHKRYRTQLPEVIAEYRAEARRNLRRNNVLQCVVILGSIVTSAATVASLSSAGARWLAVVASLVVAVAAAFGGYAKYRERSASLHRIADSLDREYQSVELRVGRYRRFGDEREAYAEFADQVEALRAEEGEAATSVGSNPVHAPTPVSGT